jgi:hypothetical protein
MSVHLDEGCDDKESDSMDISVEDSNTYQNLSPQDPILYNMPVEQAQLSDHSPFLSEDPIGNNELDQVVRESMELVPINTGDNQMVPHSEEAFSTCSQSAASCFSISLMRTGQVSFVIPGMKAVSASQGNCMVCGDRKGRSRVTIEARVDMWIRKRIFIPVGNRCCKHHLSDGIFKEEALNMVKLGRDSALMTGQMVATWISTLTEVLSKPRKILDFEGGSPLTNDDYEMLLGVSRVNFDTIFELCQKSVKRSRNRYNESTI